MYKVLRIRIKDCKLGSFVPIHTKVLQKKKKFLGTKGERLLVLILFFFFVFFLAQNLGLQGWDNNS